jgi:pilus assembly protein CpaF
MGVHEHGKIIGRLRPTGVQPTFMDRLEAQGIFLPTTVFGADRLF